MARERDAMGWQCRMLTGVPFFFFSAWDFIPDRKLPGGGCYVNQYYTTSPCVNSTLPACAAPAS